MIVSEGDQFVWPGYDLRQVPGTDRYDYGYLPPRFFAQIIAAFAQWGRSRKGKVIDRG